jgi:hypothetical protein
MVVLFAVLAGQLCFLGGASAAEYELTGLPELGRCLKSANHTGAFKSARCTREVAGNTGKYEWEEGPGPAPKFTASVGGIALETVSAVEVTCASGEVVGEWIDAKAALLDLAFKGCENQTTKKACQTSMSSSGMITTEEGGVAGHLGFIRHRKHHKALVGFDLTPREGETTILKFTCGGPPEEIGLGEGWTVSGSAISPITLVNSMRVGHTLDYVQTGGHQSPEEFEGGVKDTLIATRTSGLETHEEQAGLSTNEFELHGEERLEIKANV